MDEKNVQGLHIDDVESNDSSRSGGVVGTVKLIDSDGVHLVPTPTNDPNDPLNLPKWQKFIILLVVGIYAATSNLMTSGMSAFLPAVAASYNNDPKTHDLVLWPAFFMGVGNLISIPVAHAIGRRPVYLVSTIMVAFGCLWYAKSGSLESHIGGRDIMSVGAGTAEALCPIIVQEVFFLHERGKAIAWFCALQTVGTAALIVASPYIASDPNLGWRWWYGIFGIISGAVSVLSIIFVKETKYERSVEALTGAGLPSEDGTLIPVTTNTIRQMDTVNYRPRSFLRDMLPWTGHRQWSLTIECIKQMCQVFFFPNVFWLMLMNSAALGLYVIMSALFAGILVQPPYGWSFNSLGYVFVGQIATAIAVPIICGWGNDITTKFLSKRNGGVSEPEYRLLALIIPSIAILISTVIYGRTAENPADWTWGGIAVTLNFEYFGFVGVVVSSFVYCMDAYPQRVDAILVVICTFRSFIGFGIAYGTIDFVEKAGYEGAFNICAGIMGALMFLGIPIYFFGKQIRKRTQRWAIDKEI